MKPNRRCQKYTVVITREWDVRASSKQEAKKKFLKQLQRLAKNKDIVLTIYSADGEKS